MIIDLFDFLCSNYSTKIWVDFCGSDNWLCHFVLYRLGLLYPRPCSTMDVGYFLSHDISWCNVLHCIVILHPLQLGQNSGSFPPSSTRCLGSIVTWVAIVRPGVFFWAVPISGKVAQENICTALLYWRSGHWMPIAFLSYIFIAILG